MDMNAVAAVKAARDAGIKISIDGDRLRLEAREPPPAAVVDLRLASSPCCVPPKAAGTPRIGRVFLMSAPAWPSSRPGSHERRPKRAPSPAACPNG
jgi:hypothetical protein